MQDRTTSLARFTRPRRTAVVAAAIVACSACSPPPPRSYEFFLSDSIARDGTLARCDADPAVAEKDIECANARRAALAAQLEEERLRREALERESAAKIEALRRQFEAQRRAREAAAALGDTAPGAADTALAEQTVDPTVDAYPASSAAAGAVAATGDASIAGVAGDGSTAGTAPPGDAALGAVGPGSAGDTSAHEDDATVEDATAGVDGPSGPQGAQRESNAAPTAEIPRAFRAGN